MMVALLQTIGKQLIEYFVVPVTLLLSKSNRDTFPEGFLVTFRENSLLQTTMQLQKQTLTAELMAATVRRRLKGQ